MGVLTAAGTMGAPEPPPPEHEPPSPDDADAGADGDETETPGSSPAPDAPETKFVPTPKVEGQKTPGSRRSKAIERVEARLAQWQEERRSEQEQYRKEMADSREQIARLTGSIEARAHTPPLPAREEESPEALLEKAAEALDQQKFKEYQKYTHAAALAEARREIAREIGALREQIPQPLNPQIQYLMNQHKNVALAGNRGASLVMIKDQELNALGVPAGPERVRKAFALADQLLGDPGPRAATPARYSQAAAGALTGAHGSGNGNGKADEGVTLNAYQLQAAKAAGLSPEQYVKWMDPEKYGLTRNR